MNVETPPEGMKHESFISIFLSIITREEHITRKRCQKSYASKFIGAQLRFVEVRDLTFE